MNPAEVLVDHALTYPWSQMPQHARNAAATFLHDTLCVGVAGARAAHADEILAAARGWGEGSDGLVHGASVAGWPGGLCDAYAQRPSHSRRERISSSVVAAARALSRRSCSPTPMSWSVKTMIPECARPERANAM